MPTPADRPVPPVSAPLLSPSPAARRAPLVSDTTARHCCRGPPISLSPPPLFSRQRTHDACHPRPSALGRCRLVAARRSTGIPPCSCPASSTRRPSSPTRTAPSSPAPPKKEPDDAVVPQPLFPSSVPTLSTPRQTPSLSVHPALGAPFPSHEFWPQRRRRSPAQ
jgi:hypothetical protein